LEAFLTSTFLVAVAEIGDNTLVGVLTLWNTFVSAWR